MMTNWKRIRHWCRVTFRNACTDPECTGHMLLYDNRVTNDYCSECGRTERMVKEGVKVELEDPANPLSNYQTGGKDMVYEYAHLREVYEANRRKFADELGLHSIEERREWLRDRTGKR